LSEISYSEDIFGNVNVKIEGVDFVKGGVCYEIGLDKDPSTGFYTPFWPQNADYYTTDEGERKYIIDGAEVFNLDREISTDLGTDIGGLKAMLLARGDHRADYTDITEDGYDTVSQSILMNIEAEFDQLIHNVVTKINDILADAAGVKQGDLEIVDDSGATQTLSNVRYCESDEDGYMRCEDGSPIQLFEKITTDGYTKVKGTDGKDYWVYSEEDTSLAESLYTIKNLQVNEELMQKPATLSFRLEDGSEDIETEEALKDAFTEEIYTLNPNVKKKTTFVDYYTDLVSQVGNSGSVYRSIYENQENTVESIESAREQVVGVSSDEELSNMIKFQNAFNASSRYINVVDEMLEHLLNTLGT
jgi:flagellar hook-associated protein 1 FlgK